MVVPRSTLVVLFALPLGLSFFSLVGHEVALVVLAANGVIVLVAAIDALFVRTPLVSVERRSPDVFSLGRSNKVVLVVRSRSRRKLEVRVSEDLFEESASPDLPITTAVAARSYAEVEYHVVPTKRGAYELGSEHVRYPSPLGLWWRTVTVAARHPVRVYPDLLSIRAFELLARQDRHYGLMRAVRRKGGETEFERLREYAHDDEFRAVDWKATARRQKLTVREYQLESNQSVLFMLDAGRLMTAETSGVQLFDHALNASLLLSHVAARGGDRVGLLGFDDAIRTFVPPAGGPGAARRLIQASYALHPTVVEPDFERAFEHVAARLRKRSLVILFTQVVDDAASATIVRQTRGLLGRHLPLLVLFRDPEVEQVMQLSDGRESVLYQQAATAEILSLRDSLIRDLRAAGVLVLDVRPKDLTTALINRYLEIKARNLL